MAIQTNNRQDCVKHRFGVKCNKKKWLHPSIKLNNNKLNMEKRVAIRNASDKQIPHKDLLSLYNR